jgi:hypothetical protein
LPVLQLITDLNANTTAGNPANPNVNAIFTAINNSIGHLVASGAVSTPTGGAVVASAAAPSQSSSELSALDPHALDQLFGGWQAPPPR